MGGAAFGTGGRITVDVHKLSEKQTQNFHNPVVLL